MDLNLLWFILVCILYVGYFFLEGFDFGVGILLPFLGKSDTERRAVINTIGPHWDGNEVWLVTAGAATFSAFPHWYASMFSGFYLAFFLLLLGLTFVYTDLTTHAAGWVIAVPILAFVALLAAGGALVYRRSGWAFVFAGLTIALAVISCFAIMFPRVMISSTDAANSLTIYNAASGPYTLKVITIVALIFVPVVLAYQGWTYWVFRKRVRVKAEELIY